MSDSFIISGNLVDIISKKIDFVDLRVESGKIESISRKGKEDKGAPYIMPSLVDSHVHVESSLLTPVEFSRLAVRHGTAASVSDPHEIANVLGVSGIEFMLESAQSSPFRFCFGAPSCVPATGFETAGACLDSEAVSNLLARDEIEYLSELMNFPGVIAGDVELMKMIAAAKRLGKPIDGHAPGLRGEDARRYVESGIQTDHECFEFEEAKEKIELGMKILIREGSAAKNFEALHPLFKLVPEKLMFCSDDKHPHELIEGHINELFLRAIAQGYDRWDVLRAASLNPNLHYGLGLGLLQLGDMADFIVVRRPFEEFLVEENYIGGKCVFREGEVFIESTTSPTPNNFKAEPLELSDLAIERRGAAARVILVRDGQIVTGEETISLDEMPRDPAEFVERDICKIAVVNRYQAGAPPALAYVKGFGLKSGALASSVAHDSHNIVAVAQEDHLLLEAINRVIAEQGALVVCDGERTDSLALPIAGLMSGRSGETVAKEYRQLHAKALELGGRLHDPLMTLSFLALPVIPSLRMTDRGLFDVNTFSHCDLFVE